MNGGIGSAFAIGSLIVVRVCYPFFNAANHHRVRAMCCGSSCIASLDVEETTPPASSVSADAPDATVVKPTPLLSVRTPPDATTTV
jgi:hypothetical protein